MIRYLAQVLIVLPGLFVFGTLGFCVAVAVDMVHFGYAQGNEFIRWVTKP